MSKKVSIVAVLCLAVFSGFVAPLAGQLNVKSQSVLYKQTTTHIAWQVCSYFHLNLRLQLTIDRTQQLQRVSQPGDSSSPPSLSNLAEAQLYSGH
jgi:hypothetical protein